MTSEKPSKAPSPPSRPAPEPTKPVEIPMSGDRNKRMTLDSRESPKR